MSNSLLSVRPGFGTWQGSTLRIEYASGLLEEIRRSVQEGFHKIPHGGVETGGVLYGRWDGTVLTVSAWRPMACEHPLGPRFQLSAGDEAALAAQLATPAPELDEFQVVGWFASHSRGALQLRGPDVDLHDKFFPEPWQPILLLCALRNQPMQAAFYCRLEGTLGAAAIVPGFEVIPNPLALPRRARKANGSAGPPEAAVGALPAAAEPQDVLQVIATRVADRPVAGVGAAAGTAFGPEDLIEPAAAATPYGYEADSAVEDPPKFAAPATGLQLPWKRLSFVALWLVLAAVGVWAIPRYLAAPRATLRVNMEEVAGPRAGQMNVRWNLKGNSLTSWNGRTEVVPFSGELTVVDGGEKGERRVFPITAAQAVAGTFTYWRKSGQVDAAVKLQGGSQQVVERASFTSAEPAMGEVTPQLEKLRRQLIEARKRGRGLERDIIAAERKRP